MSDTVDGWKDLREFRKQERAELGVECPECRRLLPKANAKILMPGQRCDRRGHHYQDPRPVT